MSNTSSQLPFDSSQRHRFSMVDPYESHPWYPKGVQSFITAGASNYIGLLNEHTVLKFLLVPRTENDSYPPGSLEFRRKFREAAVKGLQVENRILQILGQHLRIIRFVGAHEDGLLLEYLPSGSVERYLRGFGPDIPPNRRLRWAVEAVEGLAYLHEKNVLHCDFSAGNLLVDNGGAIKLCDFQGRLLGPDGAVLLNGGAAESAMSSMPRPDRQHCDRKSDIFAFGTVP